MAQIRHSALAAAVAAMAWSGAAVAAEPGADPAIGRLNFAGFRDLRHCTMFAVGPRTVVTAAHCVRGRIPGQAHLLFGYAQMKWVSHLTPVRTEIVGGDVAVLCLDTDAPATLPLAAHPSPAPPDPTPVRPTPSPLRDAFPAPGTPLVAVGYGRPVDHMQTRTECPFLRTRSAMDGSTMILDCAQSPGASGGPVLDGEGAVVGVISATTRTRLLVSRLPADIAGRCADTSKTGGD